MGPRVQQAGQGDWQHRSCRRKAQDRQGQDQHSQHGQLDLSGLDLLAEVFRGPADHEAGHEDRNQGHDQNAVEP